jgi:hypothetical protein
VDSRATYLRQVRQFELAVIEFGRHVARQQAAPSPDRHGALDVAVDALVTSPLAEPDDVRRIRLMEDVDFHVRHIAGLIEGPFAPTTRLEPQRVLQALELALSTLQLPTPSELSRLDSVLERILDDAEQPLLRNLAEATPHARIRSAALHVLAIADSARSLTRNRPRRATPATAPAE